MEIEIKESHIWWMLLGIIIGTSAVYWSENDYRMLLLNLPAFVMVLIVWRVILWALLKIPIVKKHCN